MAEILAFLVELLLEILAGVVTDRPTYRFENLKRGLTPLVCVVLFLAGAGLGALSLRFAPALSIHVTWLRLVNLLTAPLLSGYAAVTLARFYQERGRQGLVPRHHFFYAFSTCLGIVLARLLLGLYR
ncbi:MAG TPA: hypothetical protein VKT74_04110 [Gammaproteobacteria bacterium]|nr:hypothetical protein [Gammaproteobacteria bacterium]